MVALVRKAFAVHAEIDDAAQATECIDTIHSFNKGSLLHFYCWGSFMDHARYIYFPMFVLADGHVIHLQICVTIVINHNKDFSTEYYWVNWTLL